MLWLKKIFLLTLLGCLSFLQATYYCEQATMKHYDGISLFCHLQNTHVENLRTHLQGEDFLWAFVVIELETSHVRGLALGSSNKYTNETNISSIFTDAPQSGLTEYLLRHVFSYLKSMKISHCGLPAQEIYRGGMKTINTNVDDFLEHFQTTQIRYTLYPSSRIETADEEILNVLRTYCHMYYRFFTGEPFFYNPGYKALDLAVINARIPGLIATYSRPLSALVVASFKEIIVGIIGITSLENIPAEELDAEFLGKLKDLITAKQDVNTEKYLKSGYITNALVEDSFRQIGLLSELSNQIIAHAQKSAFPGVTCLFAKNTWLQTMSQKYGFNMGPDGIYNWPTNMPDGSVQDQDHELQLMYKFF